MPIPRLLTIALTLALGATTYAESVVVPQMTETKEQQEERIKWFRDAKFGLFIHWGPAALVGEEISWSMMDRIESGDHHKVVPRDKYMNLYKEFNPVNFDADELMGLAKDAGMTYMVFVSKHHDGFSLWDTKQQHFPEDSEFASTYSISDTPYKRDVMKDVQAATLKHGLKLGWYYSTRDWTHPEYLVGDNKIYNEYYENQVEELLSEYGPVDMLWFDHCFGDWDQYTIPRLYEKMYKHNPDLVVNNRAARGIKDIPAEFEPLAIADYDTPENRMGAFQHGRAWESCMILSPHPDHGGWSYRNGSETRSLDETIKLLSSCVTGDGNMLLNLAPLPDGSLKPEERAILEGIAPWMKQYGEAVYATRGGPWINGDWGGATYKDNNVYLHLFDATKLIELNRLTQNVTAVTTIDGTAIPFEQSDKSISIKVPESAHNKHVTIVKLTLDAPVTGVQYGPSLANQSENVVPGTIDLSFDDATLKELTATDGVLEMSSSTGEAHWKIGLDSPGKYKVQVTTSCEAPGSVLIAHFGKGIKGCHAPVPITGGLENFQTSTMGEVYFPNAEELNLTVKPGHPHSWKHSNIKSIKLIPSN